jgi:hypothetical protein
MREGDIVVTSVAHHYVVGRVTADRRTQVLIEAQAHRADALSRACMLAVAGQRVFLVDHAGRSAYIQYDCADPLGCKRPVMAKAGMRPRAKRRRVKAN